MFFLYRKIIWNFIFIICLGSASLSAYDATPKCFRQLEQSFFTRKHVFQALAMYYWVIKQGSWELVYTDISRNVRSIHTVLRQKGQAMGRNPFDHPFQTDVAYQLLDQTLKEIFTHAMNNAITDQTPWSNMGQFDKMVDSMYQYIKEQNQPMWEQCYQSS
jgi:hypothetical protein